MGTLKFYIDNPKPKIWNGDYLGLYYGEKREIIDSCINDMICLDFMSMEKRSNSITPISVTDKGKSLYKEYMYYYK